MFTLLLLALLPSTRAGTPVPTTHRDRQLLVAGSPEQVWIAADDDLLHIDPADGHVLESVHNDTTAYGSFTVTLDHRKAHVSFEHGSFDLDQVRDIALATMPDGSADLLLTTPDTLTRVHPDGTREAIRAKDIDGVANLPDGNVAYTRAGGGLVIHSPGASCTLDGAEGEVIAPTRVGDPVILRGASGILLVDTECEPVAFAPLPSRAAALTASGLWVLTDDTLLHLASSGTSMQSVAVAGVTRAATCGDAPCFSLGDLVWDPFTGTTARRPIIRRGLPPPRPYTVVGTQMEPSVNPYALRVTASGTRVVNTASGHDIGSEIPRWAREGVVSADGRLAIVVDEDAPPDAAGSTGRSALFEVATGRELWSFPAPCNPEVLTATGFVVTQGEAWYLIDTATAKEAYQMARAWPDPPRRNPWLDAVLIPAPGTWWATRVDPSTAPARRLGGAPLPRWRPVEAPTPAEGGLADDPLRRALWSSLSHADFPNFAAESAALAARLTALGDALHSTAANPLSALAALPAWPTHAEAGVPFLTPRKPLAPGRSVAGLTGFTVNTNPVSLPLRAGRPTLVIASADGTVPDRLLAAARDPGMDVLWASTDVVRYLDASPEGLARRLGGLAAQHDPQQTVEAGDFYDELAEKLGLPKPGAMLVGPDGRVLVEGALEVVAAALQWRGIGDTRLPRAEAGLWRYAGPARVTSVSALADGGVAFQAADTVGVLNADGTLRWSTPERADQLGTSGDRVITHARSGIVARNARDGAAAWKDIGALLATGDTWVMSDRRTVDALLSTSDGRSRLGVAQPKHPTSRGDTLWEDVADGWRCGAAVTGDGIDIWVGCTPGDTVEGTQVALRAGALTGSDNDGDVLWTLPAVATVTVDRDAVLAQLGSTGGPWVTVDKRGKARLLLLTDTAPTVAPGTIYGTVDGAVVAWRVR